MEANRSRVGLWSNRNYVLLWGGRLVSGLGDQLYIFILPWLIYEVTGSATAMGTMRAVENLPPVILGLFVGVMVDRLDRRRLALAGIMVQTVLVGLLALLGQMQILNLMLFYGVGFLLATGGLVTNSTLLAVLPSIVDKKELAAANAGNGVVEDIVRLGGPALAGILIAVIGSVNSLWLDTFSFLALIVAVALLQVPAQPAETSRSIRRVFPDIAEGLRFLRDHKPLLGATAWIMVDNAGAILRVSVLLFHMRDVLKLPATTAGIVLAAGTGGTLAINLVTAVINRNLPRGTVMTLGAIVTGAGTLLMALAVSTWQLALAYAVASAGGLLLGLNYAVFRQTVTPTNLLGRTGTAVLVIARLLVPVAAAAGGIMADLWGSRSVFLASGGVSILAALFVVLSGFRRTLNSQ